ncbi:LIM and calponin homology domains-containing protein 1-like isoform X6 [Labrus mixtus]|uniref:LIM and calponin homology domains-containing protein 1-like isoform X6 n=1 Tax=Labrus mixtus TaxID=508554 RepID=UPI0029C0BD2E|nr:LIM and calponin homology domains-containing protein 1-like isoform X6 [Labrus mixtus]
MATPAAGRDAPNAPTRDDSERSEPNHPEPACQEAQKWIEAVTGKSFGEKDFRSGLENGILLCELLSAIKPGLVKKINRLPTPIAGLDNLSVFLRGCEELGLRGSQLFDPGDLQDTSIRANLRDSDCNRKLKNVLNTVFWLGKAASGCASFSGPNLNVKEFEGLLAQMKVESDEGGDNPQQRSVRDSGYDCWDSERSESLSPPRHTRDNSLDSLDSFGSRSQNSPSPDVVNRGNSDGRCSDSEADASSRRPDVRKDDMLARRTASSEARSSIPFNQFLPNRTNASSYIPTPRRKQHKEEGEQRSHVNATPEQGKRTGAHHKAPKTVTWAPENNKEKQEEERVTQEVLEQKRLQKLQKSGIKVLPAAVRYSSPPSMEEQEVRSPSPNIILRCENDFLSAQKSAWDSSSDGEEEAKTRKVPDVRKDDLATRRANRGKVSTKVHQFVPPPVCSSKDRERWEGIRRASQQNLQEKEISQVDGADVHQTSHPTSDLWTSAPETAPTPAELDARLAPYERRTEEEEEDEEEKEERIPDLQKDDMMARRTGVFHKQSTATVSFNRFLPLPSSQRSKQGEVTTDAAPRSKREVQAERSKKLNVRVEQQQPRVSMESPKPQPDTTVTRATSHREHEYEDDDNEYDENEPVPDLEKDDMMARRAGLLQKTSAARANQFLPVPGSVKYNVAPVSAMKLLHHTRPKLTEKIANESSIVTMAAEPQASSSQVQTLPKHAGPREEQEDERKQKRAIFKSSVTDVTQSLFSPPLTPPPSPAAAAKACKVQSETEKKSVEERVEEKVEEKKRNMNEEPQKKPLWQDDDDLPPMMMSRRVAFMSEDTESVSMGDILNEEEGGHLPPLSQSRNERMHDQCNMEEDDHWRDDLARWKNRRRSASQELIKKEEERKRMEKRMKEKGGDSNKRKSIKTYKEIVEEKERRELELCEAYRSAATPEEAAMVLQRYALRFTISDATLDSLKLPRSTSKPTQDISLVEHKEHTTLPVSEPETSDPLRHKPDQAVITDQSCTIPEEMETESTDQQETSDSASSSTPTPSSPPTPVFNSETVPPRPLQLHEPQTKPADSPNAHQKVVNAGHAKHTPPQIALVQPHTAQPVHTLPSPQSASPRPVPLLAAKPYCQPRSTHAGHKPVKMDGLVRVNGEATEDLSTPTLPTPAAPSPQEIKEVPSRQTEKDIPSKQTATSQQAVEQMPPPKTPPPQTPPAQTPPAQTPPPQTPPPQTPLQQTPPPQTPPPKAPPPQTPPPQTPLQQTPPPQTPPQVTPSQETAPPQTEKTTSSSASAISSLIGGRNCIITTTIVTELTQTVVEPLHLDSQSEAQVNGAMVFSERPEEEIQAQQPTSPNSNQNYSPTVTEGLEESSVSIETPMLNLAKRVNHWVWDPNEERKRLESWQQEQERLLQKQYEKEQEKLKKEWEKAQIEVKEEERKHNEEERRILEETVTPLNPTGLLNQQSDQTGSTVSSPEKTEKKGNNVPFQVNGQRISTGNEDQHASKLHFFQESVCDGAPPKKQELWKTASLDRNPQLNQPLIVKRSESQDTVTNKQQPSPSTHQPPSPSRCVSGKRLCSGCSQPLGKGAAMIIDTLGLFFHIQCFKCGVCKGQLGDATAGTDVRIRNGLLSCHECYIASRGRGQPTTL